MFADYTRYNRSGRAAGVAVFLGLALTALWFMPIGFVAARLAGSDDPGAMIAALGVGWWGALLISLATLTTNFVNIYMSALALKSLRPTIGDQTSVWLIGGDRRRAVPAVDRLDHAIRGLHDRARGPAGSGGRHPAGAQLRPAARGRRR